MQDAPPRWQRAQGRPGGRGDAELGVGSGAGPSRALGSRRSDAARSQRHPQPPPLPPPHPSPTSLRRRGARRVTRLAASPSHTQPAPHRVPPALLPLSPLHGSKCRRGQSGPKAKCSGRGQFVSFHSFYQKINSQVLGRTVTAQGDDVAASEITRKGLDQ